MFNCVQQSNMQEFASVCSILNTTSQLKHLLNIQTVLSVIVSIYLLVLFVIINLMQQETSMLRFIDRCVSIIFKRDFHMRKHFNHKICRWHCGKVNYCGIDIGKKLFSTMWAYMPVMMSGK